MRKGQIFQVLRTPYGMSPLPKPKLGLTEGSRVSKALFSRVIS